MRNHPPIATDAITGRGNHKGGQMTDSGFAFFKHDGPWTNEGEEAKEWHSMQVYTSIDPPSDHHNTGNCSGDDGGE